MLRQGCIKVNTPWLRGVTSVMSRNFAGAWSPFTENLHLGRWPLVYFDRSQLPHGTCDPRHILWVKGLGSDNVVHVVVNMAANHQISNKSNANLWWLWTPTNDIKTCKQDEDVMLKHGAHKNIAIFSRKFELWGSSPFRLKVNQCFISLRFKWGLTVWIPWVTSFRINI